jgi:hypothetical protein
MEASKILSHGWKISMEFDASLISNARVCLGSKMIFPEIPAVIQYNRNFAGQYLIHGYVFGSIPLIIDISSKRFYTNC